MTDLFGQLRPQICAPITEVIELSGFAEAYRGQRITVWVNPARMPLVQLDPQILPLVVLHLLEEQLGLDAGILTVAAETPRDELEQISDRTQAFCVRLVIDTWLAEVWSQGTDPETHWTWRQVRRLCEQDPKLYSWAMLQTLQRIQRYRTNSRPGSVSTETDDTEKGN